MHDSMSENEAIISAHGLQLQWPQGQRLQLPDITLGSGERLFISGPSGCGKSSLLGLIAGVLSPSAGSLEVLGQPMARLSGRQRDHLRAEQMGVIFQQFNLLPYLSVIDNVMLACRFSRQRRLRAIDRGGSVAAEARRLLGHLGLSGLLLQQQAARLSVGQQQRVAAARALMGQPALVIADEPTSALDSQHRHAFIELLLNECQQAGSALLFVSHDDSLRSHFARHLSLAATTGEGQPCS